MTRLKGITWDHPRASASLEAASRAYEACCGVAVTWHRRSLQAFADAPIAALAEAYDLIILDHPHVGLIAETRSLLPLEMPEDVAGTSIGGSLESYVWKDRLWAYPVDAACQVAVKRPDLCRRELPNWEAAFEAKPPDYRMVTPLLPVDAFDMMMTLVAGRGEESLPYSGSRFTSEENGILALSILKAVYRLGPGEAVTWNPIQALEAMSATDEFAYSPCLFGYINYAREGYNPHPLVYCDLPVFSGSGRKRGILGGAGIGVSARSGDAEAARAFARWVSSEPVQSGVYLENEGQPAHRGTWERMGADPRFSGFLKGARATMETAWTRPRDAWFPGFVDAVCEVFPDFFLKDKGEAAFLAEMDALYREHRREDEDP